MDVTNIDDDNDRDNEVPQVRLLCIHKDILDAMQLGPIAATFANANEERVRYFGSFK